MKRINYKYAPYLQFLFLLFLLSSSQDLFSQQKIKGVVVSADNEPLEAVTVLNQQNQTVTTSAKDGSFSIEANDGDVLILTSVGMAEKRITITGNPLVKITMLYDVASLEKIVVIGYGTAKKKDLTGAVVSIDDKDFNKGIFASADQLVQGKVAGLQVSNNNGQPGGATTIKIRGNSALSGTGQPLYVIDGMMLDGRTLQAGISQQLDGTSVQTGTSPLNFLNPDDIASIDVLKDASATAIYGSRAAYGVVIINTKKGKAGKTKLNVNASTGVSFSLRTIKLLNAEQFREAIQNYNLDSTFDKGGTTDAMNEILHAAIQQNYSIGISGGTETGIYRFSSNYLNHDGIIKNTGFKKYSLGFSGSFKFLDSKKLDLEINSNASQSLQNVPYPESGASDLIRRTLQWNPTDPLINADGSPNLGTGDNPSPVAIVNLLNNNFKNTAILAGISPSFQFTDWLQYKLLLSTSYTSGITRFSIHQDYPAEAGRGTATINNSELTTQQITNTLNFKKQLFSNVKVEAVAGFEYMRFKMKGSYMSARGADSGFGNYGLDYTDYIQFSSSDDRVVSSFIDPVTELKSYFGRTIFNYKDKYLLTATFRVDGSTKFGRNNKYGYFPSFAAAWNISNEKFFEPTFINSLKLRIGWGKTGNQEFPSGASQAKYSFRSNGEIIQVNSPNPNLKWQTDKQYNVGVDFSAFDDRLSGSVDYFNKSTTNLLFPGPAIQPAPPSSVVRWVNLDGQIVNRGLEVQLAGSIIRNESFAWNLSVNASFLKNRVKNIADIVYTGDAGGSPVEVIEQGYPMQSFYVRKFLGIDKGTGFSIYKDDGATYYHIGDPNPKTLLGISTSLKYKKILLNANMYGAFGQQMYNATLMNHINFTRIYSGGNIAASEYKLFSNESPDNQLLPSSRYIMNAGYFRMSNLSLSYNAGNWVKAFRQINIYIIAQNLFLITKYPGFDPESNSLNAVNGNNNDVPSLGIETPHYPSARTFTIGINFSL